MMTDLSPPHKIPGAKLVMNGFSEKTCMMMAENAATDEAARQDQKTVFHEKDNASCPTMRRIMTRLWGGDESRLMGHQFLLYCLPEVIFDKK